MEGQEGQMVSESQALSHFLGHSNNKCSIASGPSIKSSINIRALSPPTLPSLALLL